MSELVGGCNCGEIRYSVKADPLATVVCHCNHCQKTSGAAFSVNVIVREADIVFQGPEMASYTDHGDSGKELKRRFCATCGSSLGSQAEGSPEVFILKAGTLDDRSSVRPQKQIWMRSGQPWVKLLDLPGTE